MSRVYVTAARLAKLEPGLTDRDREILATVVRVRILTGSQLQRMHFPSVSRRQVRRTLGSLVDRRLLARLPRAVGGKRAGSAGFVYVLDVVGQRLTQTDRKRAQRPWTIGVTFLAHSLAVTELYVRLVEAERAGRLRLVEFVTEPATWRSLHGPGGARLVLKPDAAVTVHLGRFADCWFVEVDHGTEAQPTIARKCDVYRRYWQSGVEQARTGVFPRVLWLVPDEQRRAALVDTVGRQPGEARTLFAVALFDDAIDCVLQGAVP